MDILGPIEAEAIAYSTIHEVTKAVFVSSSEEDGEEHSISYYGAPSVLVSPSPPSADSDEPCGEKLLAQLDLQHMPLLKSAEFQLPQREEAWPAEDVRRHWLMLNHCEWLLIPLAYPSLHMPTALGTYYWRKHTTDARQTPEFMRQEQQCVSAALRDLALEAPQPEQLIWCEQPMTAVDTSPMARELGARRLARFLVKQKGLIMVCLENAHMERGRAMPLLRDLGAASGGRLRRLYLWHAFLHRLDPISQRARAKKDPCARGRWKRGPTKQAPGGPAELAFTLALPLFSTLTVLAANYCDLADPCGETILTLAAVRAGTLQQLHLLVVEQELPQREQGAIPDWAWRRAAVLCPELRVHLVVCACPTYDMVAGVMSRSMPLAQLHLSSGVDSRFRQPWLIDCIFREMRLWYKPTLQYLAMHLWRNRDLLDGDLIRAPSDFQLLELEFIGRLEDLNTIPRLCSAVLEGCHPSCPKVPLRKLLLRPQLSLDECGLEDPREREIVEAFMEEYEPLMAKQQVHFDCSPFPV